MAEAWSHSRYRGILGGLGAGGMQLKVWYSAGNILAVLPSSQPLKPVELVSGFWSLSKDPAICLFQKSDHTEPHCLSGHRSGERNIPGRSPHFHKQEEAARILSHGKNREDIGDFSKQGHESLVLILGAGTACYLLIESWLQTQRRAQAHEVS